MEDINLNSASSGNSGSNLKPKAGRFGQTNAKERQAQIIVFIIGLLIGFGIGFLVFADKNQNGSLLNGNTDRETEGATVDEARNNAAAVFLSVVDQAPGETVTVSQLSLAEPSWVVVYDDLNGRPGAILGAQYFDTGNYDDLSVSIFVGTITGSRYHVLVHADDGRIVESEFGRHEFDHTKDLPLKAASGEPISDSFITVSGGARGL